MRSLPAALVVAVLALAVAPAAQAGAAPATFKGKLVVRHSDDFSRGHGQTTWTLLRHGRRLPVLPTARPPQVRSGSRVAIRGRRVGRWIEGKVRVKGGARAHAAASVLGDHSVAVVLFNFADDTRQPWTPAAVDQRIFTDSNSTAAFYTEQSWGDLTLSGHVFGWYTIDSPRAGCDVDAWATAARAAAADDGVDLSLYDHVQFVFPQQSSCGWAGLGELPGRQTWLNGDISVRVAAHELGHNMGLHHASSYSCTSGGIQVAISSSCSASEYGDPFDVMGLNARHSNSWHLEQLGILRGSDVQTVTSSGTYTLRSALNRGSGSPALLRIPTGGNPARWYDLEIRQSGGVFDDFSSTAPVVNGLSIHWDTAPTSYLQSLLLDTTPGSGSGFNDSALAQGRTFSDPNVSITASSVGTGTATVDIVLGAVADTQPPSAPGNVTASASDGRVDIGWSPANDNRGVAGYRVYRDDALLASTTYAGYTDRAVAAGETHKYQVAAYDAAGNSTLSAPVFATLPSAPPPPPPPPPPPADRTAPVVAIGSPGDRARLAGRATISGSAADAGGVARIEIRIDGQRVATALGGSITRDWILRRVRTGTHTITLRAVDRSGNVASRSVRVRVYRSYAAARRAARRAAKRAR